MTTSQKRNGRAGRWLAVSLVAATALAPCSRAWSQASGAATSVLHLEVGKGQLLRLNGPASGVFVGDPSVADVQVKSASLLYIIGKRLGATSLLATDPHDGTLANMDVEVGYDLSELSVDLKRLVPNGVFQVSSANNALVVGGEVGTVGEAAMAKSVALHYAASPDRLIDMIKVNAPNQIYLRVRIVEVSRDVLKQFGVSWNSIAAPGSALIGVSSNSGATGGFNGGTTGSGGNTYTSGYNGGQSLTLPAVPGLAELGALIRAGRFDLNATIDALDSEGLATVLAEPNITALSGVPANFLAGGEYPIPTVSGLGGTSVEFKSYGVSITSTATITDDGRISLKVSPEVSALSNSGAVTIGGVTIPALTTRSASTTVEVASGQSFAIAGLLENDVNHSYQKVPGLGNMSLIGGLFRNDNFEKKSSEIIIVVTPYIVKPASHRLEVPTDGYLAPSDGNRILNGADYQRAKTAGPTAPETRTPSTVTPGGWLPAGSVPASSRGPVPQPARAPLQTTRLDPVTSPQVRVAPSPVAPQLAVADSVTNVRPQLATTTPVTTTPPRLGTTAHVATLSPPASRLSSIGPDAPRSAALAAGASVSPHPNANAQTASASAAPRSSAAVSAIAMVNPAPVAAKSNAIVTATNPTQTVSVYASRVTAAPPARAVAPSTSKVDAAPAASDDTSYFPIGSN